MKYNTPVLKKNVPDDSHKFQPLPPASGAYPYRLNLNEVLAAPDADKMTFHMVGDTGNVRELLSQQLVVEGIAAQYRSGEFMYHLGDLVYQHGEAQHYDRQFFTPFEAYPGPIFAIAGNHDSDVNPNSETPYNSLDAFREVFCDTHPQKISFSGKSERKSNIQPNIYWTLESPLATFIGLHSNVPKFGIISDEQEHWFHEELRAANQDKMLIVCVHHAPFSADVNHGSSLNMINVLERAIETTGINPDIIFSGHVHNYQRFNKTGFKGSIIPCIVAGAGGFDELHKIAELTDELFESAPVAGVTLERFCDDKHGFLQISIERKNAGLVLLADYYTVVANESPQLFDSFNVVKA